MNFLSRGNNSIDSYRGILSFSQLTNWLRIETKAARVKYAVPCPHFAGIFLVVSIFIFTCTSFEVLCYTPFVSDSQALAHAAHCAFATVADTAGLERIVASRVIRCMEYHIYACDYPSAEAKTFAGWAEETAAELLSDEDIGSFCPFALASWFGKEVFHWLSGSFDADADSTSENTEATFNVLVSV